MEKPLSSPEDELARTQLVELIQGRTRWFASGLIGLDLLYGATHILWWRQPIHPLQTATMAASLLTLLGLVLWLGRPRGERSVNAFAGSATLLVTTATLIHLALEGDLNQTTHLILVLIGACFFLYSAGWLAAVMSLAWLGWFGILGFAHPDHRAHYGLELLAGSLLGLLLHIIRNDMMARFRTLLARDHRHAAEQDRLLADLHHALENIKTLRGLIPICSSCKKIRDDQGYWHQVEAYVHARTEATFTHGLCPRCAAALRAEFERATRGEDSAS